MSAGVHHRHQVLSVMADEGPEAGDSPQRRGCARRRADAAHLALPFIALASLTSMMEGYDMGIIANAQLIIQEDLKTTDQQMEVLVGCLNLIALVGSLVAGYLADAIGRRSTITTVLSVLVAGALVMAVSPGYGFLLAGRILTGVGVGAGLVIVPVYTAELSPADRRGRMVTLIEIMINAGILLGYLVGWGIAARWPGWTSSWRLMLGIGGLPPLALIAAMRQLPESPRWLMAQNRMEESKKVLKTITTAEEDIELALSEIQQVLELEKESNKPSPIACLSRGWYGLLFPTESTWRALLSAGGVAIIQVAIGSSAIVYYTPQILEAAGFTSRLHKMAGTVVMGATKTTAVVGGMLLFDRAGRRPMLLTSAGGCSLCLCLLSWALRFSQEATGGNLAGVRGPALPLGCLCCFMVFFSVGLGPGVSVVASETFPLLQRSRGLSLCAAMNRVVSGTVAMTFLSVTRVLTVPGTFLGYSIIGIVGFVYIFVCVPETKGMTLEAITTQLSASERCNSGEDEEFDAETAALVRPQQHNLQ